MWGRLIGLFVLVIFLPTDLLVFGGAINSTSTSLSFQLLYKINKLEEPDERGTVSRSITAGGALHPWQET